MKKEWIDPNEIYVHRELNNRELNTDYIGDLSQSMQDKGFLPEFPIDVFLTENLSNVDVEQTYTCACGAHRTIAAVNAKLEQVLVTIHDGREEAFIEMMHLDNFKFDPAINSGIGQPFTQKEKRAAVTQLLLLPKYFEQTNTALEIQLCVPESSIRRWRKEVVDLLETDSLLLKTWGVSDGRLKRLRELAKTPERVDQEGKKVKVRQPLAKPTDDEKKDFYDQIEEDSYPIGEKHGFEWEHLCDYMQRTFDTDDGKWYIYRELTMNQLQKVHALLLSEDKDFIKEVVKIARTEKRVRDQRAGLMAAAEKNEKLFKNIFAPKESDYSDTFKKLRSRFSDFVKAREGFESFELEYYDYDFKDRDDPDFCEFQTGLHKTITEDLGGEAEWLKEFREKEVKRMQKNRKSQMTRWEKNREAAIVAIDEYPRKIEPNRLLYIADKQLDWGKGFIPKIYELEVPSAAKNTDTIKHEADLFKKLADAVKDDREWVADIKEPKPLVETLTGMGKSDESDDTLSSMSLEEIFEHITTRAEGTFTVSDGDILSTKRDILEILGKASGGLFESNINLLAEIGLFLCRTKEVVE